MGYQQKAALGGCYRKGHSLDRYRLMKKSARQQSDDINPKHAPKKRTAVLVENVANIVTVRPTAFVARALLLGMAIGWCPNLALGTEIYRWQDEQGNPVISDRRPAPGIPYTTLNPTRLGIAPNKRSATTDTPAAALPYLGAATTAPPTPAKRANKLDNTQALCSRLADSISKLESLPRISVRGPNGATRFLSDAERQVKLAEAIKRRDEQCR